MSDGITKILLIIFFTLAVKEQEIGNQTDKHTGSK